MASTGSGGGSGRTGSRADLYRRTFDIIVSALLLLVAAPVILLVLIGSAVSLRAWPFFVQDRIGRHGETFRFLKVRTLPSGVPSYIDKHHLDQRSIPAFCRALRRLHLDELPQLLLVLRGHMSLVGPRPEMAHLHRSFPPSFAAQRTAVRPGCTGLWQISESCTGLIQEAPEYDRFYLNNRTLRLDIWVLCRTAVKMTGMARSVRLDDVPSWALATEVRVIHLEEAPSEPSVPLTTSVAS